MTRSANRAKQEARRETPAEEKMQLIQIGKTETPATVSIRELFERMAQKEAEMIREARERALKRMTLGTHA